MATRGYTLIEILVAVGVFTVVIAAPTGFFVSALQGQQKALSSQELADGVSFSLEYMSRAMRMAKKDLDGSCIAPTMNYELTRGGKGIMFKNYQDVCQEFYWDIIDNTLKEVKGSSLPVALTSNDLEVLSFEFGPDDSWAQTDPEGFTENNQPRVTLLFKVKGIKSSRPELQPVITIQTTISQRNLDVQY